MGNEVISQMVESLGNLLRVSLSSQKTLVTLAYELELVDSYITIQKIRFEERLEFKVITDEKAKRGNDPASYHSASGRKMPFTMDGRNDGGVSYLFAGRGKRGSSYDPGEK